MSHRSADRASAAVRIPNRLRPPSMLAPADPAGARVVAVPGLGLSVEAWRDTIALLGAAAGAAAVALPGFGLPAPRGVALDPGTSAERLLGRLDDLGIARVALLGHSASSQIVAEAARRAPQRVRALVLVGPTTDPAAASWPGLARRWLRTAARERPGQVPQLLRDYTHVGWGGIARGMDAARRHRIDDVLAEIEHPLLLVRGAHDQICPQAWLSGLAAAGRDATTATVPGAAHMVPLTRAGALAARLRPFLG